MSWAYSIFFHIIPKCIFCHFLYYLSYLSQIIHGSNPPGCKCNYFSRLKKVYQQFRLLSVFTTLLHTSRRASFHFCNFNCFSFSCWQWLVRFYCYGCLLNERTRLMLTLHSGLLQYIWHFMFASPVPLWVLLRYRWLLLLSLILTSARILSQFLVFAVMS